MSNKPKLKQPPTQAKITPPPTQPAFWESPLVWLIGLVLVLGAGAVVFLAVTAITDDETTSAAVAETAPVEFTGTPLAPFASPDPAIGAEAPSFTAQTFEGQALTMGNDGIARLYGFFAHWCSHCQAELPRTAEWLNNNELPDGVEVVAISTGVDPGAPNYPPSEWFADEEWPAPAVVDDELGSLAAAFGLTSFPFWVAVDADGTVAARTAGQLTVEQFESLVALVTPDATSAAPTTDAAGIRLVSPEDAAEIYENPPADLVVLDVRTPEEFDESHLDGATLIDFYGDDFTDQLAQLDPDQPYLLYCRSGNRSGQTMTIMEQLGFTDVASVDGGIVAWEQAGLPTVR